MSGVMVDWSSAEVREGTLDVALRGELPSGWKDTFDRTARLLSAGDWGKVRLKKNGVRVHDVAEGDEERLRHFLESVVLEANEAHPQEEAEGGENRDTDDDDSDDPDAEMTERFRSFASEQHD
jgi:hypothetical protein